MATHYVYSGAGGSNNGSSWTNAYTAFASAVAAATSNGDIIKVHKTHSEEIAADTTYTFLAHISVICVDKDNSDALSAMGSGYWIGNSTTNYRIVLTGGKTLLFYGITFRISGSISDNLTVNAANYCRHTFVNCYLWQGNTATTALLTLTYNNAGQAESIFYGCVFRFGNTAQSLTTGAGRLYVYGGEISSNGSIPSTLINSTDSYSAEKIFDGVDLSAITGTLIASNTSYTTTYKLKNCKLASGVVPVSAQTLHACVELYMYNCSDGDNHYMFAHYNTYGQTEAVTSPYVNDGALYDGTNHVTWKITTSSIANFYYPYVSPWINRYHSATSAITPYLEMLRDGSATAYQDDEVRSEWSYQGTSGYPLSTIVDDRMSLLGSAANQTTSGKSSSDWTGEGGTAWFGKLVSPSITPAEIGHLSARVCVGEPSITVYVDPTIRGT